MCEWVLPTRVLSLIALAVVRFALEGFYAPHQQAVWAGLCQGLAVYAQCAVHRHMGTCPFLHFLGDCTIARAVVRLGQDCL